MNERDTTPSPQPDQIQPDQNQPDLAPVELGDLTTRRFAAVIFDMDGTLIDSTPAVERSWAIWAEEFGLSSDDLAHAHGIPAATTAQLLIAPERVDEAVVRITEIELGDVDGVVLLPGADAALSALSDARRAIATSCTRGLYEVRVLAAQLPAPAVVVTVDDVERGKPHPQPFLKAAEQLGVSPSDCLVFEDAPGGIEAAIAAGCTVVGLTTTSPVERLLEAGAVAVVADLSQIRLIEDESGVALTPA